MDLVFATNNIHKLKEIRSILGPAFNLQGLMETGIREEIPEDYETLEENASQKAWVIFNKVRKNCMADDTGLEVESLGGAPGVFSARYSRIGVPVYTEFDVAEANIRKLLDQLRDQPHRRARFRTVIALVLEGREYRFEGIAEGAITDAPRGREGFGYDPVFIPEGYEQTFAEMDPALKNRISHRAKAVTGLVQFLKRHS
ncbi:MAG: RdgB/HAM1 family non-canonical purine NTP pyrophosphatase [Bacteroidales bacterium]|nr:RdgB/HAM1 family non-canonical purine NTP pyrophosphatase [Bacteroidales bacterium]MBN2698353.1 RdgB/HAM1 family non-canonical purine NTP pyrophosphatase [Bacteroidales bacterium]